VKAFAKEMVTHHTKMLAESKTLGKTLNAMPDTAMDDVRDIMNGTRDELKDLTEKARGADWDKNYMDKMIDGHKKVLDKIQDAAKNTADPEVRKALEGGVGEVQEHLTKATNIRAKLT
jgi:putative membrane protein